MAALIDGGAAEDGRPYLVMELVRGLPLDDYCRANALGVRARVTLFEDTDHAASASRSRILAPDGSFTAGAYADGAWLTSLSTGSGGSLAEPAVQTPLSLGPAHSMLAAAGRPAGWARFGPGGQILATADSRFDSIAVWSLRLHDAAHDT